MKTIQNSSYATLVGLLCLPLTVVTISAADLGVQDDGSRTVSNNQTGNRIVATGGLGGTGSNPLILINPGGFLGPDGTNHSILLQSSNYVAPSYSGIFDTIDLMNPNQQPELLLSVVNPLTGIINNGIITGGEAGINSNSNQMLLINNGVLSGGSSGTGAGILSLGSDSFIVNTGLIEGGNSSAIRGLTTTAGTDGVTVHNTGTLAGAQGTAGVGIFLDDDSLVINSGTITGSTTSIYGAVTLGNNSVLYNLTGGSISGSTGFANNTVNGTNSSLTLYNWGSIEGTGGTAINGSGGVDNFYLNSGSSITGDIALQGGADNLWVTSDYTGIVQINGSILAGAGADTIEIVANAAVIGDDGFLNGYVTIYGNIDGGTGSDSIDMSAINRGAIELDGNLLGGSGADIITLQAEAGANITVSGDILGGPVFTLLGDNDEITLFADEGSSIVVQGGIDGGWGNDIIALIADDASEISIGNGIAGGAGDDTITLEATDSSSIFVDGGISGGSGADIIELSATDASIYVTGGINAGSGTDTISLAASNGGLISIFGGIDAGTGNDNPITLDTIVGGVDPTGSIVVVGRVSGNTGNENLDLVGGLSSMLDFGGDLNLGDYIQSTRGTGAIMILGDVHYIQNLNKSGVGLALISGFDDVENEFVTSGDSEVDVIDHTGGSLYINGNLAATPLATRTTITVSDDAEELGGAGDWEADIVMEVGGFSAGQIAMNLDWHLASAAGPQISSIGQVDITGSLTFEAGTFIRYDLMPQLNPTGNVFGNGADLITHTSAGGGVVTFEPGSSIRLSPADINRAISDGTYVIVSSDTDIEGTPDPIVSVQFNANVLDTGDYTGTLVPGLVGIETMNVFGTNLARFTTLDILDDGISGGQDLVAIIQHDYQGLGMTQNQAAVGAALDAMVSNPDAMVQDFIAALDYSDLATAINTMQSISPENQLAQAVGLLNFNYNSHRTLENYLATARTSSGPPTVTQQVSLAGSEKPLFTGTNGRVWGMVAHDWQDYEDSVNSTDYDGSATSFTAGMDWRVTSSLILGVLLEGSTSDYDYNQGSTDIDSIRFAIYGTWGEATGFYSNFALGYGTHDMSDTRNFGGIWGINNSSTDADSLMALVTVGYAMEHNGVKHGPYAGFEYQDIDVDGFNVTGGVLPVAVSGYNVESLRGLIGYRAETRYGKFSPYASIAYAHEFKDDQVVANATIAGSPFAVTTDGPGSAVLLSLGSGYSFSDEFSMSLGYRAEISVESTGLDSHGIVLGADWRF